MKELNPDAGNSIELIPDEKHKKSKCDETSEEKVTQVEALRNQEPNPENETRDVKQRIIHFVELTF